MAESDDWDYYNLDSLLFPEPVSAGVNPYVLMSLTYLFRSTNEDVEPIEVTLETDTIYRIKDGRHRAMAAMMAGRKYISARRVEE